MCGGVRKGLVEKNISLRRRSSKQEEEDSGDGAAATGASSLTFRIHMLQLLPDVLISVERRRLNCAIDCLPQVALLALDVSLELRPALLGHAAMTSAAEAAARGPARPPASAAELASMAAKEAAAALGIPSSCAPVPSGHDVVSGAQGLEGEPELASAVDSLASPLVEFVVRLYDSGVMAADPAPPSTAPSVLAEGVTNTLQQGRTALVRLLLHLIAAVYLLCSPSLYRSVPVLGQGVVKLTELLRTSCIEAAPPTWSGLWSLATGIKEGRTRGSASSDEDDTEKEAASFSLAPCGAAMVVLGQLEGEQRLPMGWLSMPKRRLETVKVVLV